jgi:hypothetical protein
MSAVSLAFGWSAPVPQPFTRSDGPTFWPSGRRYRPCLLATRYVRDMKLLTQVMPSELAAILRERFKPTRGPLRWETPPALSSTVREGYQAAQLRDCSASFLCSAITITAGLIERLLNAPEGTIGGLTDHFLFAMQTRRLLQLWEEVQRRTWEEAPLASLPKRWVELDCASRAGRQVRMPSYST